MLHENSSHSVPISPQDAQLDASDSLESLKKQEDYTHVFDESSSLDVSYSVRTLSCIVPAKYNGGTVWTVLRDELHMSSHGIRHAKFVPKGIMLDNQRVRTNARVCTGQTVSIVIGDSEAAIGASQVEAIAGPLDIIHEDPDIIVVNKPAGLVMYPGPAHSTDTLGNRLMAYFEEKGLHCNLHPVQRLDKGTSGLVVFATNAHAHDRLQRSLHTLGFRRFYLALCTNIPDQTHGIIDAPIARSKENPCSFEVHPRGKTACTRYEVLASTQECSVPFSIVKLELTTGRTHQIRVHMASLGHPLLGDELYGGSIGLIGRPALHSTRVELLHPVTAQQLAFDSPLPQDMHAIVTHYLGSFW